MSIRQYFNVKVPAKTQNWVDGKFVDSTATKWIDVPNPATNEVSQSINIQI